MMRYLLHNQKINLDYAKALVKDIPEERMCVQPGPGMNHAAWVLGHLAMTAEFGVTVLGGKSGAPKEWEKLFGWDAKPSSDRKLYPGKAELLKAVEASYARFAELLKKVPESRLSEPCPVKEMSGFTPTLGDLVVYIAAAHDPVHLGQLSAWRRVQGMPSVM